MSTPAEFDHLLKTTAESIRDQLRTSEAGHVHAADQLEAKLIAEAADVGVDLRDPAQLRAFAAALLFILNIERHEAVTQGRMVTASSIVNTLAIGLHRHLHQETP